MITVADPPIDLWEDDLGRPQSHIPEPRTLKRKYPFDLPPPRLPPAPYYDYATPVDKDSFLDYASARHYMLRGKERERRSDAQINKREAEGRRVTWKENGEGDDA
jgi:hypothetical protein